MIIRVVSKYMTLLWMVIGMGMVGPFDAHAQGSPEGALDDLTETVDIYYAGSIKAICSGVDTDEETLVNAKEYCKAYPKNCVGDQAICVNRKPRNVFHSNAWQAVYTKKLSSYRENRKTVCRDFPWTCPNIKDNEENGQSATSDIYQQLPKGAVRCNDNDDCKTDQICAVYDRNKTDTLKICKSMYTTKCTNDMQCPYETLCYKGKCVDCISSSNPHIYGLTCSNNRWNACEEKTVVNYKKRCPNHGNCPNGLYEWNNSGACYCVNARITETCSPITSKSLYSAVNNRECSSNMDCKGDEVCNLFYGHCIDYFTNNKDSNKTRTRQIALNNNFYEIKNISLEYINENAGSLNKKKQSLQKKLNDVQSKQGSNVDIQREYKLKIEYIESALKYTDPDEQRNNIIIKYKNAINELNNEKKIIHVSKRDATSLHLSLINQKMHSYGMRRGPQASGDYCFGPCPQSASGNRIDEEEKYYDVSPYYKEGAKPLKIEWKYGDRYGSQEELSHLNLKLGLVYLKGRSRDIEKAFKLIKVAADNNVKLAELIIGLMYIHGQGTAQNESKGFWYLNLVFKPETIYPTPKLAHLGALMELVKCYHYGIGTEKDEAMAERLAELLKNDSDLNSINDLQEFYHSMSIDRFSEYETLDDIRMTDYLY